ncbi:MAG: hypothetical protein BMS9Abin07_2161 [Acidimicrobiia bacterium]|nr:MAG: hypothetical protein BMS9Abin07_2161 [Acidimicrobiia bacterium]
MVTAILAQGTEGLAGTLDAIRHQVYGSDQVIVVGGDSDARHFAGSEEVEWVPTVSGAVDRTDATHLWFVRSGARPRADALGALVATATDLDAAVAGSKILDLDNPDRLLSVGFATDVFGTAFTGLDDDELDQGQYDVVRDVAAVAGDSLFVRRDLVKGLGGPDRRMPPLAAAVDFCQRARLRGARVIVVPSSEVLAPDPGRRSERWRERGSRIRGMAKVYGPLTVAWSLPVAFLSGFAQATMSLLLGRWMFFDWLRAWAWNLLHLPDTIRERRRARRGREVGDEELFRYQVGGSIALKTTATQLADQLRRRLPGEDTTSIEIISRELRRPSFLVGVGAILFLLVAVRSLWADGLPAVGYSLPFPDSGLAGLDAYAGGWNPGGFGGSEPLLPLIALTAIIRIVVLNSGPLAEYLAITGSAVLGVWGTVRLLRVWGVTEVAGTMAGLVYVAGSAAQGLAAETAIGAMIALGVVPWVMWLSLARWPSTSLGRAGRVAAVGLTTGIVALASPLLLLVPVVALLIWALVNVNDGVAWRALAVALSGVVLALPLLFPWAGAADLNAFLTEGDLFSSTSIVVAAAVVVALVTVVASAPVRLARVAGWAGVLAAGGALVARGSAFGAGAQIGHAGLALAALGLAGLAGAAFESITRVETAGWRRIAGGVGVVAAAVLVAASSVILIGGRAGIPADRFREAFAFTQARPGDPAASRILVLGGPGDLPGDERIIQGAAYRVVAAPMAELWEARLDGFHLADRDLDDVLETIIAGETSRAGDALAPFGIRWIVIMGSDEDESYAAAWNDRLTGQLDIVSLSAGLANDTYENESLNAVRAVTPDATAWSRVGTGYEGVSQDGRLTIRESAHPRWGPKPWIQAGVWNEVSASTGVSGFRPLESRRYQAYSAALWAIILAGFAWAGRKFG